MAPCHNDFPQRQPRSPMTIAIQKPYRYVRFISVRRATQILLRWIFGGLQSLFYRFQFPQQPVIHGLRPDHPEQQGDNRSITHLRTLDLLTSRLLGRRDHRLVRHGHHGSHTRCSGPFCYLHFQLRCCWVLQSYFCWLTPLLITVLEEMTGLPVFSSAGVLPRL